MILLANGRTYEHVEAVPIQQFAPAGAAVVFIAHGIDGGVRSNTNSSIGPLVQLLLKALITEYYQFLPSLFPF